MTNINKEEIQKKVISLIEDKIKHYLEADGGSIRFVKLTDDMIVYVELQGACSGCPMSAITLKAGVEEIIKSEIPEIKSVEAI